MLGDRESTLWDECRYSKRWGDYYYLTISDWTDGWTDGLVDEGLVLIGNGSVGHVAV